MIRFGICEHNNQKCTLRAEEEGCIPDVNMFSWNLQHTTLSTACQCGASILVDGMNNHDPSDSRPRRSETGKIPSTSSQQPIQWHPNLVGLFGKNLADSEYTLNINGAGQVVLTSYPTNSAHSSTRYWLSRDGAWNANLQIECWAATPEGVKAAFAFSNPDRRFIVCYDHFNDEQPTEITHHIADNPRISALSFSNNGRWLVCGTTTGRVYFCTKPFVAGAQFLELPKCQTSGPITCIGWSPDDTLFGLCSPDMGEVIFFSPPIVATAVNRPSLPHNGVVQFSIGRHAKRIATRAATGEAVVWECLAAHGHPWTEVKRFPLDQDANSCAGKSPIAINRNCDKVAVYIRSDKSIAICRT